MRAPILFCNNAFDVDVVTDTSIGMVIAKDESICDDGGDDDGGVAGFMMFSIKYYTLH
jgi:hypothetical protein